MNYIKAWIVVIICAFAFNVKAQIIVANKGMEGNPCLAVAGVGGDSVSYSVICPINDWYSCEKFLGCVDDKVMVGISGYPLYPHSGSTCVELSDIPELQLSGSISTYLSCSLRNYKTYILRCWIANFFELNRGVAAKTMEIWGNADSCSRIEKLWESGQIDTGWHEYTAILVPQQQDYEYIHFRIGLSDTSSRYLLLDALSDIYPFNGNDVIATIRDTAFTKSNNTCIELSATANITTYDTVYWQDAAGNKIADGFNGGTVCPDSSTYYVIAMRDSVQDCAGIWWSYDTVKVTVNTGTAVATPAGSEAYGVNIFPNPATNSINIKSGANPMRQVSICDINGKVLFMQSTSQKTQTQIILEGIVQTQGVYIAEVTFTNGLKQRIKFLKQ